MWALGSFLHTGTKMTRSPIGYTSAHDFIWNNKARNLLFIFRQCTAFKELVSQVPWVSLQISQLYCRSWNSLGTDLGITTHPSWICHWCKEHNLKRRASLWSGRGRPLQLCPKQPELGPCGGRNTSLDFFNGDQNVSVSFTCNHHKNAIDIGEFQAQKTKKHGV